MEKILERTYNFSKKHHTQDKSGHDFNHILRVYKNACLLLNDYPEADSFIVKMGALLHDIDDRKLNPNQHQTKTFLKTLSLKKSLIDKILSTIEAIDFGKTGDNPHFKTIEEALLFDSDKLDAIGAIGICRTILFGCYANLKLFDENIFPNLKLSKEEYKKIQRINNTTINHFFDKLLRIKNIMQTETGKKEAIKRHDFMIRFLIEYFEEMNTPKWLNFLNKYNARYNK